MKLIHLISGGDVGGAKTHVLSLLQGLNRTEDVHLICFMEGPFAEEARCLGIPTTVIEGSNPMAVRKRILAIIRHDDCQLLHCHGARANMIGALVQRQARIPVISTIHSDYRLDYLGRPLAALTYGNINKVALRRFDAWIGVSDGMRQLLISRGFDPQRIFPLYNGVDFSTPLKTVPRDEWLRGIGLTPTDRTVVFGIAARISPVKDMTTLVRAFAAAVPGMSEEALFVTGADALRLALDLYRRTGQPFLLRLMEELRSRLPDVSGVMHMFPFQREYRQETGAHTPEEEAYYARMRRFATGKWTADALAMTALLSQYSGSGRDAAAGKMGLSALMRYHGMPSGAFSADPYLAGRDPARAVELPAVCAQAEAYLDALCATGEPAMAERLLVNVLPDMLTPGGVRPLSPTNRLATDESCQAQPPEPEEVSALLRALYAIRRSVWLAGDDETLVYMLPVAGGCLTRLGGVPVRFSAAVSGVRRREVVIRVECRQPVQATLKLRVPGYADAAQVSVNGARPQAAVQGELYSLNRTFQNGDVITLSLMLSPRLENGYRGSASVYVGAQLMALPLPDASAAWRYAVRTDLPLTLSEEDGGAPAWQERAGFILPPPQGVPAGAAYELTLLPFAGTDGRIAAFPCVMER